MGLLSFLSPSKAIRSTLLKRAKQAIDKTYKQGRLKFIISDDKKIEYTSKEGKKEVMTIDECAGLFWSKLTSELEAKTMGSNSFAMYNISPEDIKPFITGLR